MPNPLGRRTRSVPSAPAAHSGSPRRAAYRFFPCALQKPPLCKPRKRASCLTYIIKRMIVARSPPEQEKKNAEKEPEPEFFLFFQKSACFFSCAVLYYMRSVLKGYSSVGRAAVSKTACPEFESLCPCHERSLDSGLEKPFSRFLYLF